MDKQKIAVMRECVMLSLQGKISFPEVVGRLTVIGVERYHCDYSRRENTYYLPDGDSYVVSMEHSPVAIAEEFSAQGVEAAVREIQRGQIDYLEFVRKTAEAGCIGYFVQIAGRRVIYFGRNGDMQVEMFPPAPGK